MTLLGVGRWLWEAVRARSLPRPRASAHGFSQITF